MDYHFERLQMLLFKVYDKDDLTGDDFIGMLEVSLGEILAATKENSDKFRKDLRNEDGTVNAKNDLGKLRIETQLIASDNIKVVL